MRRFLKNNAIVFVGNTAVNFLNYLFHLVSGRWLAPADYGALESLIGLNYFLSVFNGGYSLSLVHFFSRKKGGLAHFQSQGWRLGWITWLVFLMLFPFVRLVLRINNFWLYLVFTLQIIPLFLLTVYTSWFQAMLQFVRMMAVQIVATLGKLAVAFFFLTRGWEIFAPVWGLSSGVAAGAILGRILVGGVEDGEVEAKNFWRQSWSFLLVNLSLVSLLTSDLFLARVFLTPQLSGVYAALAVLGKIIFFAVGPVLLVVYPYFTTSARKKRRLRRFYLGSLLLMIGLGVPLVLSFALFPRWIIYLLYGQKYTQALPFLGIFGAYMLLLAVFNLNLRLLLGVGEKSSGWLGLMAALGQIVGICLSHQSILNFIWVSLAVVGILNLGATIKILLVLKNG